jgi:oxygen-independent coproporphyrinogen-3 oxidase
MLEVDEDSRLGREMLAAGQRYGAGNTPAGDEAAEWYGWAVERLASAGVAQYEISNFARPGLASRHNVKYWAREPYLGFGLDAHSMLPTQGSEAVRWANPDALENYMAADVAGALPVLGSGRRVDRVGRLQAFEESLFLGLRMNRGVSLDPLRAEFGPALVDTVLEALEEVEAAGLVERRDGVLRLTAAGNMVSNEVFGRLLVAPA